MVKNHSILEVLLIIHSDFIGKGLLRRARVEIYKDIKYDKIGAFGGSCVNTHNAKIAYTEVAVHLTEDRPDRSEDVNMAR